MSAAVTESKRTLQALSLAAGLLALSALAVVFFFLFMSMGFLQLQTLERQFPASANLQYALYVVQSMASLQSAQFLTQTHVVLIAVIAALCVLITFADGFLSYAKEWCRESAKLPAFEVINHYNGNSHDVGVERAGSGIVRKKVA